MAEGKLSTTSYAVLGLLAVRSWSAYELADQARRIHAYAWPRAQSVLYDEPKRLVALGLAEATQEASGQRTRTVYAITDLGRDELRRWFDTEPAPPRFELEILLRTMYADQGSKTGLLDAVDATRRWARERRADGRTLLEGYRDDGGPYPERRHVIILFASLMARIYEAFEEWADEAEAEVRTWPGTADLGLTPGTRAILDGIIEAYLASRAPR